jgi:hypothetical protein
MIHSHEKEQIATQCTPTEHGRYHEIAQHLVSRSIHRIRDRIPGHNDNSKLQAHSHEFGGHAQRKTNADLHLVTTSTKYPSFKS